MVMCELKAKPETEKNLYRKKFAVVMTPSKHLSLRNSPDLDFFNKKKEKRVKIKVSLSLDSS